MKTVKRSLGHMTPPYLQKLIVEGEDSSRQFKRDVTNAESLAAEMAAFANSKGGTILLGVADDGSTPGLSPQDVARINQLVGNAASHLVRSPLTVNTENVAMGHGRVVSPGHLPNNLTVEKIRTGNSNIRNPILVSYIAKGLLPYHGLGSGIKRALEKCPDIEFTDDREGCLFTATVHRKPVAALQLVGVSPTGSEKPGEASGKRRESVGITSSKILDACRTKSTITIPELAALIGVTERSIERNIQALRKGGFLRRVGGRKEGRWEVVG